MLQRSNGKLLPRHKLPRDPSTGQLVVSGFVCVVHRVHKDRLTNDKRGVNETERHLDWLELPGGSQFCLLFLSKGATIRASADDFETYFYSVMAPEGSERWSATGQPWPGHCFSSEELQGQDADETYFCMTVPRKGCRNSVDLCQAVHEGMLRRADCLRSHETMRYRWPPPNSNTWEGAYADNRVVVQKLTMAQLQLGARLRDSEIVEDSVASYLRSRATLALDKRVRFRENFIAWGTEVRGRRGIVGSDRSKRAQIGPLVFDICAGRVVDQNTLDCVLLSSVLHRIYKYKAGMPPDKVCRLPGDICDELLVATLFLALADCNVRAECPSLLLATDAAPFSYGSAVAPCPAKVV